MKVEDRCKTPYQWFIYTMTNEVTILNTGTDCGFCPPLLLGEGWGEGFQKSANRDRSQYISTS